MPQQKSVETAIILAGGLGTRLRTLVSDRPKPMALVHGRPFLAYLLDYWISQGISKFILSVGYMSHVVIDYFGDNYHGSEILYSIEKSPLGTGGALIHASSICPQDKPILLLNGDTFFDIPLSSLSAHHQQCSAHLTLSAFTSFNVDRYTPLSVGPDCDLLSMRSTPSRTSNLVNAGHYIFEPRLLDSVSPKFSPSSLEEDLIPFFLSRSSKITTFKSTSNFIDIGIPSDYLRAPSVFQRLGLSIL